MLIKPKRSTGFQLSDTVLRAVCLRRSGQTVQVAGKAAVRLAHTVDTVLTWTEARRAAVLDALKEVRQAMHSDVGSVCVGVRHGAYFFKERPLLYARARGRRQQRENREHLLWEAKLFLDEAYRNYVVDVAPMEEHAFIVGVRHTVMEQHAKLFAASQLPAPDFDIEPFALHNIAEAAGLTAVEHTVALVGRHASGACLLLEHGGRLAQVIHCNAEDGSADTLTGQIAQKLDESLAAGKIPAPPAAFWVAGDDVVPLCEHLQDRLACPCAPLPWQRAIGAGKSGADATSAGPGGAHATGAPNAGPVGDATGADAMDSGAGGARPGGAYATGADREGQEDAPFAVAAGLALRRLYG